MDMIVTSLSELFTRYGARSAAIILLTVVAVNLIKRPLVGLAEKVADRTGTDKSVLTRYVSLLPVPVALLFDFICELFVRRFNLIGLSVPELLSRAVIYGGLAMATYESIKKQLEAYAAKKQAANGETAAAEIIAEPDAAEPKDGQTPGLVAEPEQKPDEEKQD